MQVVSAIPQTFIIKARIKCIDKTILLSENKFQLSPDTTINLLKLKKQGLLLASDK